MSSDEGQHTKPDRHAATIGPGTALQLRDAQGRSLGRLDRFHAVGGRAIVLEGEPVYHRIFEARFVATEAWIGSEAKRLVEESFACADDGAFAVYDQLQAQLRACVRLHPDGETETILELVSLDDGDLRSLLLTVVVDRPLP